MRHSTVFKTLTKFQKQKKNHREYKKADVYTEIKCDNKATVRSVQTVKGVKSISR